MISRNNDLVPGFTEATDVYSNQLAENNLERALMRMKSCGFSFDRYHDPKIVEYHYDEGYIGMLFFFREVSQKPICQKTIKAIESIHSFLTFIFAHLVMRSHYYEPTDPVPIRELQSLRETFELTNQQGVILTHLLLGRSYKETADILSVTEGTVKKQISSIYRKVGVHSYSELLAKHFLMPRGS
jgi:DNA-binding CsgD family transcriptional regulator